MSDEGENQSDDSISSLSVVEDSNSLPAQQLSSTPTTQISDRSDGAPIFKKYPDLSKGFDRQRYNDNRVSISTCRGCNQKFKSNKMSKLIRHGSKCESLEQQIRDKIEVYAKNGCVELDDLNMLITKFIVKNNLPFRILDCRFFKTLVNKGYPDNHLVSRITISDSYISALSEEATKQFYDTNRDDSYTLSIEFDHYEDYSHRSLLGVLSTKNSGRRYLLDIFDVSIHGKSGLITVDLIEQALKDVKLRSINSIISDSASACKLARQELVDLENYKHVIEHRCLMDK